MSQKILKPIRQGLALFCLIAITLVFINSTFETGARIGNLIGKLQFVPAVLRLITPGAVFVFGVFILIVITVLFGRIYCSTICPLGVFQDLLIRLKKIFQKKQRLRYTAAHNILRYCILGVLIVSPLFAGLWLINKLDPYAIFGRAGSSILHPVWTFLVNKTSKVLINNEMYWLRPQTAMHVGKTSVIMAWVGISAVTVMALWKNRLYCNTVCPVGTLLGLFSKLSFFKLKINEHSCTSCGKCMNACKANCINIKTKEIDVSRCVACYNCLPICEEKSISYKTVGLNAQKLDTTNNDRRSAINKGVATMGVLLLPSIISNTLKAQRHNRERRHGKGKGNHVHYENKGNVTPPGSIGTKHLIDKCIACHACVTACPTKVIRPANMEYGLKGITVPLMDYNNELCEYECTKCGDVCPTGAILPLTVEEKKLTQMGVVEFRKQLCIVETDGTACGSCSEHCPTHAVEMVPYHGDLTIPIIHPDICVGCGACEYACPVTDPHKAIYVVASNPHGIAEEPTGEQVEVEDTEEFPF